MTDQHPWDQQNLDNLEQGFDYRFAGGDPTVNPADFVGPNAQRDYYEALEQADADGRRRFEGEASPPSGRLAMAKARSEAMRGLVRSILADVPKSAGRLAGEELVSATVAAAALSRRSRELPWERWKLCEWTKRALRRPVMTETGVVDGVAVDIGDGFGGARDAILMAPDGRCLTGIALMTGYNSDELTFEVDKPTGSDEQVSVGQILTAFAVPQA